MFTKVLIVDDDQDFHDIAKKKLEQHLAKPLFFFSEDGEEALEIFKAERPDLVIMDVMMPVKNGWEACRQMKRYEETHIIPDRPKTTIIIVTAIGPNLNEMTAPLYGADDYFDKPTNWKQFIRVINEHLRQRQAA